MYDNTMLVPMFDMEFYESFLTPTFWRIHQRMENKL